MSALEDGETEKEMSFFHSCQEVSDADFRFVEECASEKEVKEVRDILLERLVLKAWNIYEGGS